MSTRRYTWPAMQMHWAQAVLVLYLLWLGWTMTELPKGAERSAAYGLHKSFGLLGLLLLAGRLAWRRRHSPPPLPGRSLENRLAQATHLALYGFLLLAPLAGYLASSFTPYAVKFFAIELPKAGWPDEWLNGFFKRLHQALVWGGAALIGLHVAGGIRHLIARDGLMQRMLPTTLFRK